MNVHRSGHLPQAMFDFLSELVTLRFLPGTDLNVDGSRQAEVQNLIGHVGGLEEEG